MNMTFVERNSSNSQLNHHLISNSKLVHLLLLLMPDSTSKSRRRVMLNLSAMIMTAHSSIMNLLKELLKNTRLTSSTMSSQELIKLISYMLVLIQSTPNV